MLRNWFRQGCRQIIVLYGIFFKSVIDGALLATIRKDNDNRMFPIAWVMTKDKTNNLVHSFWRYYFEICPFQMELVGLSFQTNKRYTFMLFNYYFII